MNALNEGRHKTWEHALNQATGRKGRLKHELMPVSADRTYPLSQFIKHHNSPFLLIQPQPPIPALYPQSKAPVRLSTALN